MHDQNGGDSVVATITLNSPSTDCSIMQAPLFNSQAWDTGEFFGIVSNQDRIVGQSMRCNQQIHRTNDGAIAIKPGADLGIVLSGLNGPGLHVKAGQPSLNGCRKAG